MGRKDDAKKMLATGTSEVAVARPVLSTGSTLLNLACGGTAQAGWSVGKFYLVVGDSTAGKTFLAMSVMAEACYNKAFDKHALIYDNVEGGMDMDLDRLFGPRLSKRLMPPHPSTASATIEDFYYAMDDAMEKGPVIYILDSMDALTTKDEESHFQDTKRAAQKGKDVAGSYGVDKAKSNSVYLRRCLAKLRETGSILIILSQTRDNLGWGFEKKKRSGGHALRFYASLELWASVKGKIKRTHNGKERVIGIVSQWDIKKNRLSGRLGKVMFDIYPSFGIDDLGCCIDYLVGEKFWRMAGRTIMATGLSMTGSREKLVREIEAAGLEGKVSELVGKCWAVVEDATSLKRKSRYE